MTFNCILLDFTNFRIFPYTLKSSYFFALLSIVSKFQWSTMKDDGQSPKNDHSPKSNTIITVLAFMVNSKISLSTPWTHTWGVEVELHSFLTLALDGSEWLTSSSSCFTPGERTPVPTEQEAGWTPELVWSFCEKRKIPLTLPRFKPWTVQPVAFTILTTLPWLTNGEL